MKIKGAITHDVLCIQDACEQEFKNWVDKNYNRFGDYKIRTYCDGELYANFGGNRRVSFREYLRSQIKEVR